MQANRLKRLVKYGVMLGGSALVVTTILLALSKNINVYYTPGQIAEAQLSNGVAIRLGGFVVPGSIVREPQSLAMTFLLEVSQNQVKVTYTGVVPSLLLKARGQWFRVFGVVITLKVLECWQNTMKTINHLLPQHQQSSRFQRPVIQSICR